MLKEFQGEKDIQAAFAQAEDDLAEANIAYAEALAGLDTLTGAYVVAVDSLGKVLERHTDLIAKVYTPAEEEVKDATPIDSTDIVAYYTKLQQETVKTYNAQADALLNCKELKSNTRANRAIKNEIKEAQEAISSQTNFSLALRSAYDAKKYASDLDTELKNHKEAHEWVEAKEMPIWVIMYYTFGIGIVALLAVLICVFVITGLNNWKSLLKLLGGIAIVIGVIVLAYTLADGGPVQGAVGDLEVTKGDLMLTDTILNLAYFMCGGVVISLIVAWIYGATRK